MNNLEQLAALLFDAVVNLDPQEFDAVAGAVARFKSEEEASYSAAMRGGAKEFVTLFGAVERAVARPTKSPVRSNLGTTPPAPKVGWGLI